MSIYIWQTKIFTFCACPLPFPDTTDVQLAESISANDDIIKIMCYFARGSQALGCSVELVSPEDSVLWNITRDNGSPVAERGITTALPAHCYNISVSDLEREMEQLERSLFLWWKQSGMKDAIPTAILAVEHHPLQERAQALQVRYHYYCSYRTLSSIFCGYQYKALDFLHSQPFHYWVRY